MKGQKTMKKTIWFDMDGTLASLYDVKDWLSKLEAQDASPYVEAQPMHNMSRLARYLNKARKLGYKIGIISWLSKVSTPTYDADVTEAKKQWLNKHLTSVSWDELNIVNYGTPKSNFITGTDDILFDDELKNRTEWHGVAYEPNQIFEVLRAL